MVSIVIFFVCLTVALVTGTYIVQIFQSTVSDDNSCLINLGEILLLRDDGSRIYPNRLNHSAEQYIFYFTTCFDNNLATACHSMIGTCPAFVEAFVSEPVSSIVLWNRDDCCQVRIRGATVSYMYLDQLGDRNMIFSSVISTTQANYTFNISTFQPTLAPTSIFLQEHVDPNSFWMQIGTFEVETTTSTIGQSISLNGNGTRVVFNTPTSPTAFLSIYDYSSATDSWEVTTKPSKIDGYSSDDLFGFSNAISRDGSVVVVGTPLRNGANAPGMITIYRLNVSNGWDVEATFDGLDTNDNFGQAVAISGDGRIVAAVACDGLYRLGYVALFHYTNNTWSMFDDVLYNEEYYFNSRVNSDIFYQNIALNQDGNILIIGYPKAFIDNQVMVGFVRTFYYNSTGSNWAQFGQILYGGIQNDEFGMSVTISNDGNTMAVGSYNGQFLWGKVLVYAYNRFTDLWELKGNALFGKAEAIAFGMSVSLSGDGQLLAAGMNSRVEVYAYNVSSNMWVQIGGNILVSNIYFANYVVALNELGNIVAVSTKWTSTEGKVEVYVLVTEAPTSQPSNQPSLQPTSSPTREVALSASDKVWIQRGNNLTGQHSGGQFGQSVSLNGDGTIVAVGSNVQSIVQVFEYSSITGEWLQKGSTLYGAAESDWFGFHVALNAPGDVVICGAPYLDSLPEINNGGAFVYEFKDGDWSLKGNAFEGFISFDFLGANVAINADGSIVAVVSPGSDDIGQLLYNTGIVQVYRYEINSWVQLGVDITGFSEEGVITTSHATLLDHTFVSMNAAGNIVAIGAPRLTTTRSHIGGVAVYRYSNTVQSWETVGNILIGSDDFQYFGQSVSLNGNGNILAVASTLAFSQGQISIYSYDDSSNWWTQIGNVVSGDYTNDLLGYSIALNYDGTLLVAGAIGNSSIYGANRGFSRLYTYVLYINKWEQVGGDLISPSLLSDGGQCVDINDDGNVIAISAESAMGNGTISVYQNFISPSPQPSSQPSTQPSCQPSSEPSLQPTRQPSYTPSTFPSSQPTYQPSIYPTSQPSCQPTAVPSFQPTSHPSCYPSSQPSTQPSQTPAAKPTTLPSVQPSQQPSSQPSCNPSCYPSCYPSAVPTTQPTTQPSYQPSILPSGQPSSMPTIQPFSTPTSQPSRQPLAIPSMHPSRIPSVQPTNSPTTQPSSFPSISPLVVPSSQPSGQPSGQPSVQPSCCPSSQPSQQPSMKPTSQLSSSPSTQPTIVPSAQPIAPPTTQPSAQPSMQPSVQPTVQPTMQPTIDPTSNPSNLVANPSSEPSTQPISQPSSRPTCYPSKQPSSQPTTYPSCRVYPVPTMQLSSLPTVSPSIHNQVCIREDWAFNRFLIQSPIIHNTSLLSSCDSMFSIETFIKTTCTWDSQRLVIVRFSWVNMLRFLSMTQFLRVRVYDDIFIPSLIYGDNSSSPILFFRTLQFYLENYTMVAKYTIQSNYKFSVTNRFISSDNVSIAFSGNQLNEVIFGDFSYSGLSRALVYSSMSSTLWNVTACVGKHCKTQTMSYNNMPVPTLLVNGVWYDSVLAHAVNEEIVITINMPNGRTLASQTFEWSISPVIPFVSLNSSLLRITPYMMSPNNTYMISVIVHNSKTNEILSSQGLHIFSTLPPLLLRLIPSERTIYIPANTNISLKATLLWGRIVNAAFGKYVFTVWSCNNTPNIICGDAIHEYTGSSLTIFATSTSVDSESRIVCSIKSLIDNKIIQEKEIFISSVASTSMILSLSAMDVNPIAVTKNEITIQSKFRSIDSFASKVNVSWALIFPSNSPNSIRTIPTPVASRLVPVNSISSWIIPLNRISYASLYVFRISCSLCSHPLEIDIVINTIPFGGTFEVKPRSGEAMLTNFALSALGWNCDPSNLPLAYTFSFNMSSLIGWQRIPHVSSCFFIEKLKLPIFTSENLSDVYLSPLSVKLNVSDILTARSSVTADLTLTCNQSDVATTLQRLLVECNKIYSQMSDVYTLWRLLHSYMFTLRGIVLKSKIPGTLEQVALNASAILRREMNNSRVFINDEAEVTIWRGLMQQNTLLDANIIVALQRSKIASSLVPSLQSITNTARNASINGQLQNTAANDALVAAQGALATLASSMLNVLAASGVSSNASGTQATVLQSVSVLTESVRVSMSVISLPKLSQVVANSSSYSRNDTLAVRLPSVSVPVPDSSTTVSFVPSASKISDAGAVGVLVSVVELDAYLLSAGDVAQNNSKLIEDKQKQRIDTPRLSSDVVSIEIVYSQSNGSSLQEALPTFDIALDITRGSYGDTLSAPQELRHNCSRQLVETVSLHCAQANVWLNVTCSGRASASVRRECPVPQTVCSVLSLDDNRVVSNDYCRAMVTQGRVQCSCGYDTLPNDHNYSSFVEILALKGRISIGAFSSFAAGDLDSSVSVVAVSLAGNAAEQSVFVLLVFSSLWGTGLLLICWIYLPSDWFQSQIHLVSKTNNEVNPMKSAVVSVPNHAAIDFLNYLVATLPLAMQPLDWYPGIAQIMKRNHHYVHIVTTVIQESFSWKESTDSPQRSRTQKHLVLRIIHVLTAFTVSCFVLAVLYDLQYPIDDGYCGKQSDKMSCLYRKSLLDPWRSYCAWQNPFVSDKPLDSDVMTVSQFAVAELNKDPTLAALITESYQGRVVNNVDVPITDVNENDFCRLNNDDNSLVAFIFSFVVTSLFSALFSICLNICFTALMAEPLKELRSRISAKRALGITVMEDSVAKENNGSAENLNYEDQQIWRVHDDLRLLRRRWAVWMKEKTKDVFGISTKANMAMLPSSTSLQKRRGVYSVAIGDNIIPSQILSSQQIPFKLQIASDDECGLLILQHLLTTILDLNPETKLTSSLLSRVQETFFDKITFSKEWIQQCFTLFVILLNCGALYFIVTKAIVRGPTWQEAYLQVCAWEWFTEVFIIEVAEILILNWLLPSLVRRDVLFAVIKIVTHLKDNFESSESHFNDDFESFEDKTLSMLLDYKLQLPETIVAKRILSHFKANRGQITNEVTIRDKRNLVNVLTIIPHSWLEIGVSVTCTVILAWLIYLWFAVVEPSVTGKNTEHRSIVIGFIVLCPILLFSLIRFRKYPCGTNFGRVVDPNVNVFQENIDILHLFANFKTSLLIGTGIEFIDEVHNDNSSKNIDDEEKSKFYGQNEENISYDDAESWSYLSYDDPNHLVSSLANNTGEFGSSDSDNNFSIHSDFQFSYLDDGSGQD